MQVRGDDLWITITVPPRLLVEGGRIPVVTPIGRRILWVTKKAGERRLLRAPGLGLPARGRHAQGCLFVRLAPKTGPLDSAARVLLRRFSAAWAA
jgi:curved DNA-binding protein